MGWVILVLVAVVLIGAVLYWQLIIAEGAYLGRWVVIYLYDLFAKAYDGIKEFESHYEQVFLGSPLRRTLSTLPDPLVLDVATGTGRLPLALFLKDGFQGRVIGLDLSRKMLKQAVLKTQPWASHLTWIWQDASQLPFSDATFDAVTCMEALEFTPRPLETLRELVRVLRPGGVLLTTNRIGPDARFMPGRTFSPEDFEKHLQALPLEMIRMQPWQVEYDLIWAMKKGALKPPGPRCLEDILVCPRCGHKMSRQADHFVCEQHHQYPLAEDGILELV